AGVDRALGAGARERVHGRSGIRRHSWRQRHEHARRGWGGHHMSISITLQEGNQAIPASAGNVVARVGVTSSGTVNTCSEWDGGQDAQVPSVVGYGPVVESTERALRINGEHCVLVKANASISGSISSVVKTGTSPNITAALGSGAPYGNLSLAIKILTGGALGVAQMQYALDGASYNYAADLPAELPATVVGTADLTAAGALTALNGKTFLVTPDGGSLATTTFGSLTSPADVAAAVQTALGAYGVATIVGGKYLKVTGITKGVAGALVVGAGTGNSNLGITAGTTAGLASTFQIPKTGITLTFTSGTYVAGDTYTATATAPKMTISDAQAALDALRSSGIAFGLVEIVQDPVDGVDTLAWAQALDAKIGSWHTASANRI